jgi:hypothetical protein
LARDRAANWPVPSRAVPTTALATGYGCCPTTSAAQWGSPPATTRRRRRAPHPRLERVRRLARGGDGGPGGRADRALGVGGGLHHAFAKRANGFCVYNDPAVAIHGLLDAWVERVAFVDIDAHHPDGSGSIFYDDPRVLVCSVHEDGRFPFPGSGRVDERGVGEGEGATVNVPLPAFAWRRALPARDRGGRRPGGAGPPPRGARGRAATPATSSHVHPPVPRGECSARSWTTSFRGPRPRPHRRRAEPPAARRRRAQGARRRARRGRPPGPPRHRRGPRARPLIAWYPPLARPLTGRLHFGDRPASRSDDGLRGMQASELPEHEEQAEHAGPHRAPEVLSMVRPPHAAQGNPVAALAATGVPRYEGS